jgi:iron complex outermembrane receptor protein
VTRLVQLAKPMILAGPLMCLAAPVVAQTSSDENVSKSVVEEIVVTARKREESLQDIPLTVSVFQAEQIEQADIRGLEQVSNLSPGFRFVNQGNAEPGRIHSQLKFRGMTTAQYSPSFATGALFIDGIYVLNGGTSLSLMDVAQIEVIKGPQAAYFGRNTFGGAINLITRNPNMDEFAGEVSARYTDRNTSEYEAIIEGPIVPGKLSFSLAGRAYDKTGHYVATDGGRTGNEETKAVNAVLLWQATDNFSLKARYGYSEDDDGPATSAFISGELNDTCTGKTINTAEGPANPRNYICGKVPYGRAIPGVPGTGEISSNTFIPRGYWVDSLGSYLDEAYRNPNLTLPRVPKMDGLGLRRETERFSLFANYEFDSGYSLKATFGKNVQHANIVRDTDNSDRIVVFSRDPQDMEDESYEVRFSSPMNQRLRWMVGYNRYEQEFTGSGGTGDYSFSCYGAVQSPPSNNYPFDCVGGAPGAYNLYFPNALVNSDRADVQGFFGSIDFDITDQWTAIVEGRWQEDKLTKGAGLNTPGGQVLTDTFEAFLPRVILRWKPLSTTTLWVSYSEGQIAGDFNAEFINADARERAQYVALDPNLSEALDAESLEAWEIGWKQSFAGGRGQFNLAVYDYKWENIKGRSSYTINETCKPADMGTIAACDPANGLQVGDPKQVRGADGSLIPFYNTRNLLLPGDAKIRGAELEAWFAFTDSLTAQLGVAYIDSEYTDYKFNFVQGIAGFSQMKGNQTPRQSKWSGNATLTWNTNLFGYDVYTRGDWIYTGKSFVDESNLAYLDAYSVVNARIGMNVTPQLTAEFFVTNLFEEEAWQAGGRQTDFARAIQIPSVTQFQGVVVSPLDKREFGLRMNYRF